MKTTKVILDIIFILVLMHTAGCIKSRNYITAVQEPVTQESTGKITEAPYLNISTGIESGDCHLVWNYVRNATTYIVQRDLSSDFFSPELFYCGSFNSIEMNSSTDGIVRYYRVRAANSRYSGPWSNVITLR